MSSQASSSGSSSSGGYPIKEIVTNSGIAKPSGGTVNITGGTNINTIESGNNVLINLDDNISIDEATIGSVNINGNTISTTGTDQDLVLSPNGLGRIDIDYLSQSSILVTDDFSDITDVGIMTDGQLAIGSTGSTPVANTLTAGAGIDITNGPGSITISSSGTGGGGGSFVEWTKIVYRGTGQQSFVMERNKGYICDSNQKPFPSVTRQTPQYPIFLTLPDVAGLSIGDVVAVASVGAVGTVILVPEDVTLIPFSADPSTGFIYLFNPGGIYAAATSSIWIQYLGITIYGQKINPTWQTMKVQGRWIRNSSLPNSGFQALK